MSASYLREALSLAKGEELHIISKSQQRKAEKARQRQTVASVDTSRSKRELPKATAGRSRSATRTEKRGGVSDKHRKKIRELISKDTAKKQHLRKQSEVFDPVLLQRRKKRAPKKDLGLINEEDLKKFTDVYTGFAGSEWTRTAKKKGDSDDGWSD